MGKRLLMLGVWLAAASLVCCSCGLQASLPTIQPAAQQTVLRIWLWQGSGFEQLIERYKQQHPNVDVEIIASQYDDIVPNLMTAFATRADSPDLVLLDSAQINRVKKFPDYFYNLYAFGEEKQHYLEWKWRQAENKQHNFLFALPADIGPVALAYRHDLFAAAGLPADRDKLSAALGSWDALERAGVQLKQKTGVALFDNLNNVYLSYLNQYEYEQGMTGTNEQFAAYNARRMKEAWDRAIRFHRLGLNAGLQSQTPAWAQGAVDGKFAVVLGPSWLHGLLKKNAPATAGKWDLARPPGQPSNWNGTFLSVPATSRSPNDAYELARWLTAPAQQLTNFTLNGNFPSTPESYASSAFIEMRDPFFHDAPAGQIYSYTALRYKGGFEANDMTAADRMIRDALRRVETEGADPERLWEAIAPEIGKQDKPE